MSKQVDVRFTCPNCGHIFRTTLYRSVWIEYPQLRELVFSDRINVVDCRKCKTATKAPFSLLATNTGQHIAVWYEPFPDAQVDADKSLYEKVSGEGNFLAEAPRRSDWSEFKETILMFERGELVGKPPSRMDMRAIMGDARKAVPNARPPSVIARLFKRK